MLLFNLGSGKKGITPLHSTSWPRDGRDVARRSWSKRRNAWPSLHLGTYNAWASFLLGNHCMAALWCHTGLASSTGFWHLVMGDLREATPLSKL